MLHVILLKYVAPLDQIEGATPAHRLDQHYRSGLFLTSGPREPRVGGMILAAGDLDTLREVLRSDPFAVGHLAEYEIIAFKPVKRGSQLDLPGVPLVE